MLRSVLGGIRRQGQKKTVMWSPDVEDNSKPLPDLPREGMTDDEALKKSDEKSVNRRTRKHPNNNSDFAQIGSSTKANYNLNQKSNFSLLNQQTVNYNFAQSNNKTSFNFDKPSSTPTMRAVQFPKNTKKFWFGMQSSDDENLMDNSSSSNLSQQPMLGVENLISEQKTPGKFNAFSNSEGHQTFRFETQSSEDDSSVVQENKMDPLSDFAVDQAAQISRLTEDERKRNRTLRFAQPSQNQKPQKKKNVTIKSQELEQLGTRVKDFVDTTKLYAQVQDAIISKTSNEMTSNVSGRTRAWDYFDDGLNAETKNVDRFESKVETLIDYQKTPQALDNMEEDGLELGNDLTHEINEPRDADAAVIQVIEDFPSVPFVPFAPLSNQFIKSSEVTPVQYEEEPITDGNNDNEIVDKNTLEKSDTLEKSNTVTEEKENEKENKEEEKEEEEEEEEEEEIDPAFRFTTICDLRDEVFGSSPQSRREVSFKRKATFKKAPTKIKNDSKSETELSRRRKDRLATFDANRANSITKVLNELNSAIDLDTPAERLFRLEHPDYFPIEPSESREERLYEYERARSEHEAYLAKLMAKQESRQEKTMRKRHRELEDEELLREAKKVARQKIQEEMGWTPPSDAEISNWREQRERLSAAEEDVYDEKESDEENVETYYTPSEKSTNPSTALRSSSIQRNKKGLSYSELRRRVRERERNKQIQVELAKIQETVRKCQIEDLRHQVLEEERVHKRQKLVDLSNERDRRDAKTIQHIREVAASKIAIGRAIRELEGKIATAEAELYRKRRFEDMVKDQSAYMKCIRDEELQNRNVGL